MANEARGPVPRRIVRVVRAYELKRDVLDGVQTRLVSCQIESRVAQRNHGVCERETVIGIEGTPMKDGLRALGGGLSDTEIGYPGKQRPRRFRFPDQDVVFGLKACDSIRLERVERRRSREDRHRSGDGDGSDDEEGQKTEV
jgi:hypothetical protein